MTKQDKKFCTVGVIGAVIAALCCFTSVLVIGVTAIGLASIVIWLDYVLFPILLLFLSMVIYSFVPKK